MPSGVIKRIIIIVKTFALRKQKRRSILVMVETLVRVNWYWPEMIGQYTQRVQTSLTSYLLITECTCNGDIFSSQEGMNFYCHFTKSTQSNGHSTTIAVS